MNENVTVAKQLPKDRRIEFYQAKYDYYKSFNRILMIVATIAYLSFFITDCGIFGTIISVLKHDGVVEGGTGRLEKEKTEEGK